MRVRAVVVAVLLAGVGAFAPHAEGQTEARDGTAVYKDLAGMGACSFPDQPSDWLHVGVSTEEYADAGACGGYLEVTGPAGAVRVQVTDRCDRCPAGTIDLSRSAFERIADLREGRVPVRYQPVRDPSVAEPISVRVKDGSTSAWAQFQVIDHGNPLARVELANPTGDWRPLTRSADNFWTAANPGPDDAPHQLRITDIYGQSATVTGITLTSGVQQTQARLYPLPDAQPPTATTAPAPSTTTSTTVTTGTDPFDPTPSTPEETAAAEATSGPSSRQQRGRDPKTDNVVPIFVLLAGVVVLARITAWRRRRRTALPRRSRPARVVSRG